MYLDGEFKFQLPPIQSYFSAGITKLTDILEQKNIL